jgi:uncharacterized cofD-like protein
LVNKNKKVVVIGGGTGTFTILSGLKKYLQLDISVIVSMMDDGGSNRVIRDEFGLLPTSDLRQCMVALASTDSDETLRKLFTYRYENGVGIAGMTFGNLFMAALTDIYGGDQKKAIEETCELLGVNGKIIPVTLEKTNLVATYENGKQVLGEHEIDEPSDKVGKSKIADLQVFPKISVNKDALTAIRTADLIILGPGDFYTSILPNIIVDGIAHEIVKSQGKVAFIMNLMTKYGQTIGYRASTFVSEINKYLGKEPDIVLINSVRKIPGSILKKYEAEKAELVRDDLKKTKIKVVRKQLISNNIYKKSKSDKLVRSLIRHDSEKLAKAVVDLLQTSI